MQHQLVVALDVDSLSSARNTLSALPEEITWFKIGLQLFAAEGPSAARMVLENNKKVFLDLKFHDIPNTVANAIVSAAKLGVSMLTLHACGGRAMMKAAADAARECEDRAPKLIAVTTLTSLDAADLADIGIARSLPDHALTLADMAVSSGMDGVVTSVHEAPILRRRLGDSVILVTPGIRPSSESANDQKRVATPTAAVKALSDFLVVGRPILNARDPAAAAKKILEEMRNA